MKDISEINRSNVLKRWNRIFDKDKAYLAKNSDKFLHLKARLHGYLCGDGSISIRIDKNKKTHHELCFYPDNLAMLNSFIYALRKVYNKTVVITKYEKYYRARLNSKTVVADLLKDSDFRSKTWSVPNWIKNNSTYLREWLRAFFDSEAYVGPSSIRVQTVNFEGANFIIDSLNKFGIFSRFYIYKRKNLNWNDNFHVNIGPIENRKLFLKRIGFIHTVKLRKIQHLLRSCQNDGIRLSC